MNIFSLNTEQADFQVTVNLKVFHPYRYSLHLCSHQSKSMHRAHHLCTFLWRVWWDTHLPAQVTKTQIKEKCFHWPAFIRRAHRAGNKRHVLSRMLYPQVKQYQGTNTELPSISGHALEATPNEHYEGGRPHWKTGVNSMNRGLHKGSGSRCQRAVLGTDELHQSKK